MNIGDTVAIKSPVSNGTGKIVGFGHKGGYRVLFFDNGTWEYEYNCSPIRG